VTSRAFHIGDILSVTTGHLVSPRLVYGVYDILNYMTGQSLYTHQLGRAMEVCRPALLAQHPQLAHVDAAGVNRDNWRPWRVEQEKRFGQYMPVEPLAQGAYEAKDPYLEAIEMSGTVPLVVELPEENEP